MTLSALCSRKSLFRVEVSGWDENQSFFVEKSELEWDEESDKQVTLSHSVQESAVVFLRLMQPISTGWSQPVAYETEFIGKTADGRLRFRLHTACPRMDEQSESLN